MPRPPRPPETCDKCGNPLPCNRRACLDAYLADAAYYEETDTWPRNGGRFVPEDSDAS